MVNTVIADVIVPEIFNPYLIQRTKELSAIRSSGIAVPIPDIVVPVSGKTLNLPFWNDLTGDDEVLSDIADLTPAKITTSDDIAVIHVRGKLWSANELAGVFAGDDPMRAIADLIAGWWSRQEQKIVLSELKGVFAAASMSDNVLDISGGGGNASVITGSALIDAISLLGDAGTSLTGIITHSAVMYDLAKKNLLDQKISVPGVQNAPELETYLGRKIIADDSAPVENSVYTTYLFGQGAIGYAEGSMPRPTATDYEIKSGNELMANRRRFIFHPRGVKWQGTPAGVSPTNTELGTGTNWLRVYENKSIRIVALKHRIGPLE
jgi:hypothetical protein